MARPEMDIKDALKIGDLFTRMSENDKNMALDYLSALTDKAIADGKQEKKAQAS